MYAFLGFMLFVDYCVAPVKDQRTHDNNIITLDKFTPINRKFVFVQTIVHTYTHTHTHIVQHILHNMSIYHSSRHRIVFAIEYSRTRAVYRCTYTAENQ